MCASMCKAYVYTSSPCDTTTDRPVRSVSASVADTECHHRVVVSTTWRDCVFVVTILPFFPCLALRNDVVHEVLASSDMPSCSARLCTSCHVELISHVGHQPAHKTLAQDP